MGHQYFVVYKDPYDVIHVRIDCSRWLEDGEIVSSQDIGDATGLSVDGKDVIEDGTKVVATLSGGTLHNVYRVPYRFSTNGGRSKKVTVIVRMREG